MKSLRFLPLFLLSMLVLSACDSGDDNDVDVVVPTTGTTTTVTASDPAVTSNVAQAQTDFAATLGQEGGLKVDAANTALNTSTPVTVSGGSAVSVVTSVLVNAAGQATSSAMVNLGGETFLTTPAPDRSLTLTDSKRNKLKIQFDSNNRYQTTTFTAGTGAGRYSSAVASQFDRVLSADRDVASKIVLQAGSPGVTGATLLNEIAASGKGAQLFNFGQLGGIFGGIIVQTWKVNIPNFGGSN